MKSMTGYGRGEQENTQWQIVIEVKAVNHRYSEVMVKQPRQLLALEDKMKKLVAQYIERGKVDIFVRMQEKAGISQAVQVDQAKAETYHLALQEMAQRLQVAYQPDVHRLIQLPDVIVHREEEEDAKVLWPLVEEALREALGQHVQMRQMEGNHIREDMMRKLQQLEQLTKAVAERSPLVLQEYQEKLRQRIADLLAQPSTDEERLAQEIAYFAEKSCIDEELVRLQSHFAQFRQIIEQEGSIGRKLDFLIQEMNRETNTIGSKANDLTIGRLIVEMKSELEKLREQVQNIE